MRNDPVTVDEMLEVMAECDGALSALCAYLGNDGPPKGTLIKLMELERRLAAYGIRQPIPVTGTIGGAA